MEDKKRGSGLFVFSPMWGVNFMSVYGGGENNALVKLLARNQLIIFKFLEATERNSVDKICTTTNAPHTTKVPTTNKYMQTIKSSMGGKKE